MINRQQISDTLYHLSYFVLLSLYVSPFLFYFYMSSLPSELGGELGQWAVRMLWIVATPGILKRFGVKGVFQNVQIILMKSRRRLGDITFMLAFNHFLLVQGFFYLKVGLPNLLRLPLFIYFGAAALTVLFPLLITSNNYSVRTLKENWQRIHNLIYLAVWLIALHLLFNDQLRDGLITVGVAILQALSWIVYKRRQKIMNQKAIQEALQTGPVGAGN